MIRGVHITTLMCLFVLPAFISCINDSLESTYFSASQRVDIDGWYRSDAVEIPISQSYLYKDSLSDRPMDVMVRVRYTDKYRYKSLYLLARMIYRNAIIYEDTLQFDFSESEKSGFSYREQVQTLMQLRPDSSSYYGLYIRHLMQDDSIMGISDIICEIK